MQEATVYTQIISDLWPVMTAIVGLIIWLVRLESKTKTTEKDLEVLQTKHDTLNSKVVQDIMMIRESLARIEGAMGVKGGVHTQQNHS